MTLVLQFLNPAFVELHYPVNLSAISPYQWDILAIDMYFPKKKKKTLQDGSVHKSPPPKLSRKLGAPHGWSLQSQFPNIHLYDHQVQEHQKQHHIGLDKGRAWWVNTLPPQEINGWKLKMIQLKRNNKSETKPPWRKGWKNMLIFKGVKLDKMGYFDCKKCNSTPTTGMPQFQRTRANSVVQSWLFVMRRGILQGGSFTRMWMFPRSPRTTRLSWWPPLQLNNHPKSDPWPWLRNLVVGTSFQLRGGYGKVSWMYCGM